MSVLVVAQSSSEIPEGLMNNPVYCVAPLTASQGTKISFRFRKDTVNTGTLNMDHQES